MKRDTIRPVAALVLLWLLYFHPLVLHPTQTLYAPYSDFLAEHLPAKLFLSREWRATGELPLWNPHHFCGSPFVHDIQVGMFYPPYAVTYLVPEIAVGAALSWVVALHVLLAGLLTFAYAHSRGLNEVGSSVAAVGFMLSSKWMTHLLLAGHTITIGLVWLPLILLLMERAIANRSALAALGAGGALALLGLGTHPQWAFYAGVFALAWTLPSRERLGRWAACWAGAAVVAALLAAVQLLPTVEAAGWSARSGGLESRNTVAIGIQTLFALVGPSRAYAVPLSWETQGVFGLLWLGAAAAAPLLAPQWKRAFAVTCGLFVFALGGAALIEWLPGFSLFRVPTRMLVVAAFPVAVLAGVATDALVRAEWAHAARVELSRGFRRATLAAGLPTVLGLAFSGGPISKTFVVFAVTLLVSLVVLVRLLQTRRTSGRRRTLLWCAVLLADLIGPIATLPDVRPQAALYPSSPALEQLTSHPGPVRVLDWEVGAEDARASLLGVGAPLAMVYGVDSPRGYNPLDVRHYREFVAYIVNDPGPIRGNTPYTQQVLPNFEVANAELFRLLAVTHRVVTDDVPPLPGTWKPVGTADAPTCPPLLPNSPAALPVTVSAAADARPRAWVVPRAEPMPPGALEALKACDFSRTVLISGDAALPKPVGERGGVARIAERRPNRITLDLDGTGGYLVLSEVWFPGWTCRVDGQETDVLRANHAFRAVAVPPGASRAEFVFAPRSYRVGWWVSAAALAAFLLLGTIGVTRRRVGRP